MLKCNESGELDSAKNRLKTSPKLPVNRSVSSPKGQKSPSYKCKKGSKLKLGNKSSSPLIKSNKKKVKEDKKDKSVHNKKFKTIKNYFESLSVQNKVPNSVEAPKEVVDDSEPNTDVASKESTVVNMIDAFEILMKQSSSGKKLKRLGKVPTKK